MNFYEILGVSADATDQQIKEAYRREAMKWHPDRHEGFAAKGNADRRFKDLALAYRTLRDPAARTEYDRQLKFKLNQEFEARQREQARQRQEQERQRQQKQSYREQPKDDFADTQRPPDEEETMSGADADQMFREQMLDLATELAARGFPEFNIYKALVALGCPENMAKVVAAIAAKRGDTADVGKNGATKSSYQNSTSPPESDNTLRSKAIAKSWEDSERLFIAALVGPGFECPSNTQFTMIKAVRAALFFAMTAVIFGLFTQGESLDMDSMIGIFILSPLIGWGLMFGLLELSPSHRQYVLTHRINTYLPILKDLYLGTKKHRSSASIFFPAPWFGYYGIVWPLVGVAALFFTIDFLLLVYVGSDVHKQTSLLSIYKFAQNPLAYSLFWIGLGTMFNQLLLANIKSGIEKFNVKGSSTVEQKLYEKCRPRLWRAYLVTALFFSLSKHQPNSFFHLPRKV